MLAILRILILLTTCILICILGSIYCALYKPCNSCHAYKFGKIFSYFSYIFGIQLIIRYPKNINFPKNCIYIANHQNNFDMITVSRAIRKNTITIGKKSLIWVPFFGILYWISGNLLINRKNKTSSLRELNKIKSILKDKKTSIWIFPEGTRSHGRGLLPFKPGAFYIALQAQVPIIPICVSNTSKIKINQYNNGPVIVEMLPPINIKKYRKNQVKQLSQDCYNIVRDKLKLVNEELLKYNYFK
ncbi:MAG: 1-acylglycerol-3-phosphate O-acyltransferase [Wigglesworthia glossinidia]|nr:1-acylglycerol-3-phosphate O-acyltransferase [Wigglesworthia glossinidia]